MKISIFLMNSDVKFLKAHLRAQPKNGRGLLKKWAEALGIHTSLMSQIMSETRTLTEEQALDLTHELSLPQLESEYFMTLVRLKNAGTSRLRKYHEEKLENYRRESNQVSARVQTDQNLSEKEKATFYSSWIYSAVRITCSIATEKQDGKTIDDLHRELRVNKKDLLKIIEFLREAQLLKSEGDRFVVGSRFTHLEKASIHLPRHHMNWRMQAAERATLLSDEELMYTAPFSISEADFAELREKSLLHIQEFLKTARDSTPEKAACFNLDLFYLNR